MKTVILLIAGLWLLVVLAEPALANCQMVTIMQPGGKIQMCQVCTFGAQTQVRCF